MSFKVVVLNLIINGIPSIQQVFKTNNGTKYSFKPYYKWNTFNTYNIFNQH